VGWQAGESQPVWQLPGAVSLDSRRLLGVLVTREGDVVLFNALEGRSCGRCAPTCAAPSGARIGRIGAETRVVGSLRARTPARGAKVVHGPSVVMERPWSATHLSVTGSWAIIL